MGGEMTEEDMKKRHGGLSRKTPTNLEKSMWWIVDGHVKKAKKIMEPMVVVVGKAGWVCSNLQETRHDEGVAGQLGGPAACSQGCHKGRFWMKITIRTSFSFGRLPASAFIPRTRFYLQKGFYRPWTR
jgi:hypothetical protein